VYQSNTKCNFDVMSVVTVRMPEQYDLLSIKDILLDPKRIHSCVKL